MLGDEGAISQAAQEVAEEVSLTVPACPLYHCYGFVSVMEWLDGEGTSSPRHTRPRPFCPRQWLSCRQRSNKRYALPESFINENV